MTAHEKLIEELLTEYETLEQFLEVHKNTLYHFSETKEWHKKVEERDKNTTEDEENDEVCVFCNDEDQETYH